MPAAPITPRTDYGAAWTGRELFVWGGLEPAGQGDTRATASGALFSPATNEWRLASSAPLAPRVGPTTVAFGSGIAVWGGVDPASGALFTDGATYDPAQDQWAILPRLPIDPPERAQLVGSGSDLYIIAESPQPSLLRLIAGEDEWTVEPAPPDTLPEIDLSRAAWIGRGVAWLIYPASGPRAVILVYDTVARRWNEQVNTAPVAPMLGAPMLWTGDDVLVLGADPSPDPLVSAAALSVSSLEWRALDDADGCHTAQAVWTGAALLQQDPPRSYTFAAGCQALAAPPGSPREGATPVWTGRELIVWSGSPGQLGAPASRGGLVYSP